MRLRLFGRKISDVLKVAEFMDKENIQFELVTDVEFDLPDGKTRTVTSEDGYDVEEVIPQRPDTRVKAVDNDPAWKVARHDGMVCENKAECKHIAHYGAEVE